MLSTLSCARLLHACTCCDLLSAVEHTSQVIKAKVLCAGAEDRRILAAVRVDNEGFADLNELSIVQFPGSEERPLYMRPGQYF